ncbi:ABC-type branched-chain amino acid transport system, substrate-binding protein [Chitinophaga costaii]|uniref:ABC-type branched-chain amino acid transport system, substrate-binding protein n=1 Tax=Chitinophaga costaii TaxID=1335309 RepID=A0A1C4C1W5_9BACT|nr:amino acid ABC transporter substrate-binding protein [Chitinophaga costaii]PUZ27369.1 amino acid ABC transporter substrate-binding protein [Chitinophaga costaii]SCC13109.1 ABC-type branched-chain amino acid transport system, substrate-binding protein [Chitinophaga costaii]
MIQIKNVRLLLAGMALAAFVYACSSTKPVTTSTSVSTMPAAKPAPAKTETKKTITKAPFNVPAFAREKKKAAYNIAVFAPFYLDSAFAGASDLPPGRSLPRFALPGLEFYEGVQLAADTLQQQGINVKLFVYDNKSRQNIPTLISSGALDSMDLIMGSLNAVELKDLSEFARNKEINLVSATYPNDAGINNNPFLLLANSTLRTHCEALQNFAQKGFSTRNILLFHRNSPLEKKLAEDFKTAYNNMDYDKKSRIRDVVFDNNITDQQMANYLLTDRPNVCIVTALDEAGAKAVVRKLAVQAPNFPLHIFGMPTWDVMKFKEPEFKGLQVYYSTPYFNEKNDVFSRYINDYFRRVYKARPSDMVFKGFELTYYFAQLLQNDGVYFTRDVNNSRKLYTNYNFQPVYAQEGEAVPAYFENKNIYIIQKSDSTADLRVSANQ